MLPADIETVAQGTRHPAAQGIVCDGGPSQTDDGLATLQRYPLQKRLRGMKQLPIWVPDPHRPEFAAEANRQGRWLPRGPRKPKPWISSPGRSPGPASDASALQASGIT
jgi:hypothetical protein